ncbi:MAG: redoxin domain-containing protein [Magnetospirillum sp.]|nr:redoxin domain-containing protein [Magnetospirillum sp.]
MSLVRSLALAALLGAASLPADAALPEGHPAPVFTAQASQAGKAFSYSLDDALKRGPVVVYFYPAAFTSGCSLEAQAFAENLDRFTAAGATIVGVSLDPIARLNEFSADPKTCAGKFAVASDADGRIAKSYDLAVREASAGRADNRGAPIEHGLVERATFVVGSDGRIAASLTGLGPLDNVEKALAAVERLKR